jgi:hypothetical protein
MDNKKLTQWRRKIQQGVVGLIDKNVIEFPSLQTEESDTDVFKYRMPILR